MGGPCGPTFYSCLSCPKKDQLIHNFTMEHQREVPITEHWTFVLWWINKKFALQIWILLEPCIVLIYKNNCYAQGPITCILINWTFIVPRPLRLQLQPWSNFIIYLKQSQSCWKISSGTGNKDSVEESTVFCFFFICIISVHKRVRVKKYQYDKF